MTLVMGDTARTALALTSAGQTFTRIASRIAGASTAWDPTFTDLGGGAYEASYAVNTAGQWEWIGTATDGTVVIVQWDVASATGASAVFSTGTTANYCTLTDLKARIDRADALDDTQMQAMITAASRAIDSAANRRFYQLTETRTYTAADNMRLLIDDLVALTSLKTDIAGTRVWDTVWASTDYDLLPDNAAGINWPYTEIRPRPFTSRWFPTLRKGVQIVGTWGWPVTPDAIVEATILQASRLFVRKSSPYGVAGMGNFGQVIVPKLDPDVQMLVQPYARYTIGSV